MSAILTVFARKGGVGRTTLIHNLAGACAEYYRVLVVDTDNQASLSKNFFGRTKVESFRLHETVAAIFDPDYEADPEEVIHDTEVQNIWIVPSSDHFLPYDRPVGPEDAVDVYRLREFLLDVEDQFDVILVDTPPNVRNFPGHASLLACDGVFSSVHPQKNSCESVLDVKQMLTDVISDYNHNLIDLGYVVNNYDIRRSYERAQVDLLHRLYGEQVFKTILYSRVALCEVAVKVLPITHGSPQSEEAKMYRALFEEIVQKMMERKRSVDDNHALEHVQQEEPEGEVSNG